MLIIPTRVIRMRKGPMYVMVIFLLLFVFIAFDRPGLADTEAWIAAGGLALFIVVFYFLGKTRIIIDNERLKFQYFFKKQAVIAWEDMLSTKLGWHYHGHGATIEWEFISRSGKKTFYPFFYSRKSLQLIAEALMEKCPDAVTDKRIRNMAAGKFPWYLF
jgi:hypothetical protein